MKEPDRNSDVDNYPKPFINQFDYYSQTPRKESPMIKMNQEHIDAISQGRTACSLRLDYNCSPVFKRIMEKQSDRLREVQEFIESLVHPPPLPYDDGQLEKDIQKFHEDHSHGTTPRQGINRIR